MKTTLENIEKNIVKVTVTVEAEQLATAVNEAYKKNVKQFNIPGFRKGKAPLMIIKKMYGEDIFNGEAGEIVVNKTLHNAVIENNLKVVEITNVNIEQCETGKEFIYTAEIVTLPEVTLGEYKGVEVEKSAVEVTDEEVEADINAMREQNARIEVKEGEIADGDIAVIDFEGFVDGVAFEGGKGEDYSLTIGSHTFIDTFEEQLVGLKAGDSKDVVVTFPEQYGKEELNGKEATFKVVVKEVKVKELPEVDDEFVKEVSEFNTVAELKEDTKKKMLEYKEHTAKHEFEEKVLSAVTENATIDIPEVMIEKEIDAMVRDLEQRLKYQGLDMEGYLKYTNSTMDKVKDYMKESAEKRVRTDLVIGEIAKAEDIKVTDEEIKEKATELAKQWGAGEVEKNAEMLMNMQKQYLTVDIINKKVIDLLVSNAKAV
ncbi:trigger factor [Clostridium bornimense]|uniref:trigger factor n=1 Tax=Clostridium bornimense TaxID=1216932 RepID=UPI001C0FFBF2|nr:trigger factor [Clostridium bornimense]MBU5316421.1 trigger factor [Clostridium bornimense]